MNLAALPVGSAPAALDFAHFPTRFQAVIFRNWELVSPEKLAAVLGGTPEAVLEHAGRLGLRTPPRVCDEFPLRGYVTLIRLNWHLLPYGQLLTLLGWSAEKLAFVLKNEDFLWVKMGFLKPSCEEVRLRDLTSAESAATDRLRATLAQYFPADREPEEPPFGFIARFEREAAALPSAPAAAAKSDFELRIAYSYSALYGDALSSPELDPYPEALLKLLADRGINAVWLPGLLHALTLFADAPEISAGWEKRIATLNTLVARAAKYGIKLFIYLNEPRGLPVELFAAHPELKDKYLGSIREHRNESSMCTSRPAVLEWLANSVETLFRQVPGLGGAFTITYSENVTHCHSRADDPVGCPLCAGRDPAEIIAEVNTVIVRAARRANPEARILVWNWGPWPQEWAARIIPALPAEAELLCVSENGLAFETAGVKVVVNDYSISHPGPSERSQALWQLARQCKLRTAAKIQLGNSWEGATVPYIPATRLVEKHLANLRRAGVDDLMVSWTLGGYPSLNMDLLTLSHDQMVGKRFGARAAAKVTCALDLFSEAFSRFPFDINVVYTAPHNAGPSNLLWLEPTGYAATMVGFPYDDLPSWRGPYPAEVFEQQLMIVSQIWSDGLSALAEAGTLIDDAYRNAYRDLTVVAEANYCCFRSAALQCAWVRLRGEKSPELREILLEERDLAIRLHELARRDSRLGFEATNHYAWTCGDLREKVLNVEHLLAALD
ncbi:MAG: hypothetical protein AB7F32_00620 [Victivallaceae bacterium]